MTKGDTGNHAKRWVRAWPRAHHSIIRFAGRAALLAWNSVQFVSNARHRSERLSVRRHRDSYHQVSTATRQNRFPDLFDACRRYLEDGPRVRLLSFGCSTGEEVVSLAERWPQATIVGVDLNEWCLEVCRRRQTTRQVAFHHSLSSAFTAESKFDAIFCLAVLQRTDNRAPGNVVAGYEFCRFEREIVSLDRRLNVGGLLVIDHADFRFADTVCAVRYSALADPASVRHRRRPLYGRDNLRLADEHTSPRVFVKAADEPR